MPAEWGPQDRIWMAFPSAGYTLGDTEEEADAARRTWAQVANAIAGFEPVHMLATADDLAIARELSDDKVILYEAELDDAWMRDIGPTFVLDEAGELAAVNWVFNGWGAQSWATWEKDAQIARWVAQEADVKVIDSPIVNEGGGIHVDGEGTVLLTETVQLDEGRNPGATKADIEAEMARCLGATTAIWLPRGLTRDYDDFGTRGHVDIVATFTEPGVVLVHDQENPEHPDHEVSRELITLLEAATDARGRRLKVVRIPAPATLVDDEGPVDYSYVNHLVVNGGVIACTFGDAHDERALEVLRSVYPGREVVGVDAREIFARGGGIHCITQQQPAVQPN
ncbi:agmatine/peptidylarginine deiminase [Yimella sp. cx-51]|uniref:agmatine deiminase family protein n=1 Tax=Yimella sp. cx-51 TaxID=2770551 RepID=UPI00165D5324|nr:agmatine deiminase family protein [Yimella sp. cx-51]MBC9957204.1 agmatine deiminase family protein [Yimella sp. cx-51]QTH39615.1 agmatine deiminase family protein [Yimella sp. cx-51]